MVAPAPPVNVQRDVGPNSTSVVPSGYRTAVPVQGLGTYYVKATINRAITLRFMIDSGADDVTLPADVVLTLIRTGTIADGDFLGTEHYMLADGSTTVARTFRIRELQVGDVRLENVRASVAPVTGALLLGQSFLKRFSAWSIDNQRHLLLLN